MPKNFTIIPALVFLIFTSLSFGQIMPNMSPSMLSQISKMSDAEKRTLAQQYGIEVDGLFSGMEDSDDEIGVNTEEITSDADRILIERILDNEENRNKAKEYKKRNIPLFKPDFGLVEDLPIYGQFLFEDEYSTFAPVDNAPVPSDYLMGTGDTLRVLLFGSKDSEFELLVDREGEVNFPEIGNINIAGMTFDDASRYIKKRISDQMIGVDASISMGRLKSINVFMAGETKIPGSYSISGLSTVSQALFVAGGVTDIGSLRDIQVRRSNSIIANFDLYKLLIEGEANGDIRLQSGDIIFVPVINTTTYIDGAIKRPGRYEIKNDETILDLIMMAGGFTSRAFREQVYLESYSGKNIPSIKNLNLTNESDQKLSLKDGDVIKIAEISDKLSNSIIIKGAVKRPGNYGWYPGIKFTDIIQSINTDFSANFDISKGLISRRKDSKNYDIELVDFSIKDALENPKSNLDPTLDLHDEVLIFSLGHNDDALNDIEFYDPGEDMGHPSYFVNMINKDPQNIIPQNQQITAMPTTAMPVDAPDQLANQISDSDLEVIRYETIKRAEYEILNQGKRRILLEPIIKKLYQQATSSDSAQVVSISGAVKVPGEYPLTKDATYQDLILLAGGYSDDAFVESAELRRKIINDQGALDVQVSDINLSRNNEFLMKSRDHIHIRNIKDWDARDSVTLVGEVAYPGDYLISPNETLSSVIRRAGGFTTESFIDGAIFTRESIKEKEREQLQILGDAIRRDQASRSMTKESEDFSVSSSELEAGIAALMASEVYGRLIVNVKSLMEGELSEDIVLQDGDMLTVPKYTNAVTVVGEVRRAGSFVRKNKYSINDYLQLAAGMTARGDRDEIYIIRADGSVNKSSGSSSLLTFDGPENEILAGDTIVVPIKSTYQTPLNLYSTVSQVVFQSIASIAAFSSVFN